MRKRLEELARLASGPRGRRKSGRGKLRQDNQKKESDKNKFGQDVDELTNRNPAVTGTILAGYKFTLFSFSESLCLIFNKIYRYSRKGDFSIRIEKIHGHL